MHYDIASLDDNDCTFQEHNILYLVQPEYCEKMEAIHAGSRKNVVMAWAQELSENRQKLYIVVFPLAILTAIIVLWLSPRQPVVKILLADEIGSSRQRALEYAFNPRRVTEKGYAQVRDLAKAIAQFRTFLTRMLPPLLSSRMRFLASVPRMVSTIYRPLFTP